MPLEYPELITHLEEQMKEAAELEFEGNRITRDRIKHLRDKLLGRDHTYNACLGGNAPCQYSKRSHSDKENIP